MAKKTKTKSKKASKSKKRTSARKAPRKPVRRKVTAKGSAKAKRKAAPRKTMPAPAAAPAPPPASERIGVVTHYYNHLSVAIVQLETGNLRVGELVRIKGHTSDFTQPVESMEVEHVPVNEVRAGQVFGLRVKEHAREHDVVYKVVQ